MSNNILFEPFPKQQEFLEAVFSFKYDFILYGGAIRGGKTYVGLWALVLLSRVYPGSRWAVVRNSIQTIKRNTYPSWHKMKPEGFIKSHNLDTHTITFTNNSQLIFFGENYDKDKELNRWRGLEVNGFLLEEINKLQEVSFFKALERAGSYVLKDKTNQPRPLILSTCNPTRGWVKERFYDRWKENSLPDNQIYIPSKIDDNPFIDEQYKNALKSLPRYEYEVFVNGRWDIQLKSGNEFFKSFELEQHVKAIKYDISYPFYVSVDNNVYPYIAISIWQVIPAENELKYIIKQVHEICAKDPDNTASRAGAKVCRWLSAINNINRVFICGDPTTQSRNTIDDNKKTFLDKFVKEIEKNHAIRLKIFNAAPPVASTGDFINAILETNYNGLKIEVGENCINSISDYIETKEDASGGILKKRIKDAKTGISYEEHGHLTDTMRYFIVKTFENEYNKYKNRFKQFESVYFHKDKDFVTDSI